MASLAAPKILIFAALKAESQGEFEKLGYPVIYTGIGKVKAGFSAAQNILKEKPDWVINLGTAGSRRFPVGTIVECTEFVQRDPLEFIKRQKINVPSVQAEWDRAICGTADFVDFSEGPHTWDVMDMEGFALAYVCEQLQVRFTCLKYITDASRENTQEEWKLNLNQACQALKSAGQKMITSQER